MPLIGINVRPEARVWIEFRNVRSAKPPSNGSDSSRRGGQHTKIEWRRSLTRGYWGFWHAAQARHMLPRLFQLHNRIDSNERVSVCSSSSPHEDAPTTTLPGLLHCPKRLDTLPKYIFKHTNAHTTHECNMFICIQLPHQTALPNHASKSTRC